MDEDIWLWWAVQGMTCPELLYNRTGASVCYSHKLGEQAQSKVLQLLGLLPFWQQVI